MAEPSDRKEGHEKILLRARKRFARCVSWESDTRALYRADVKFANGDSDNNWQWPDTLFNTRDIIDRPCLTINKTRVHNRIIKNDARKNKTAIKIRPTGGDATALAAGAFMDIVRRIEYKSNATGAYDWALSTTVDGGIGWVRVVTKYLTKFEQEAFIERIKDPLAVYCDRDIKEDNASDANYLFVFEEQDREDFEVEHPDLKVGAAPALNDPLVGDWLSKERIRKAEYFERQPVKDKLWAYTIPETIKDGNWQTGEVGYVKDSEIETPELRAEWRRYVQTIKDTDPNFREREVTEYEVKWYKIAGDIIYDEGDWEGSTIPFRRMVGEEIVVDGELDRKGQTRTMKDPQRMLNYNASGSVEFGALQTKTPWVGPMAAFEGYETDWNKANVENKAWLGFNHIDDEGNEIPAPTRPNPPQSSELFMSGMEVAERQMMMASGQYQDQFGQKSNVLSGVALDRRNQQGDNATFHFTDNQAMMIAGVGQILIEIIPKIYDTERTVKIMAEDGTESDLLIDPNAKVALQKTQAKTAEAAQMIFNPCVGQYDVVSNVSPDYATKRQATFDAIVDIIKGAPEWRGLIGDILFRNADFDMADEAAKRLRRTIPAHVLGEGESPQVVQLTEQVKNLQGLLVQLSEKLVAEKNKHVDAERAHSVDVYEAESKRLTAETNAIVDMKSIGDVGDLEKLIKKTISDMFGTDIAGLSRTAIADHLGLEEPGANSDAA